MTFEDHRRWLFDDNDLDVYRENVSIRSFHHQLKTISTYKFIYNNYDDERVILEDHMYTSAYGHSLYFAIERV
ncbi:Hypothetical protein CINCED_3A021424 [Cinara cedri]|uniref:Uncharacterized protein n=1 Tax=Cinara cedri TaxID=506608 RepID=A0A5E4NAG7_9HEMI|nr:Hypothetical protein CINCED_3A021424 [Cinara cedri]